MCVSVYIHAHMIINTDTQLIKVQKIKAAHFVPSFIGELSKLHLSYLSRKTLTSVLLIINMQVLNQRKSKHLHFLQLGYDPEGYWELLW